MLEKFSLSCLLKSCADYNPVVGALVNLQLEFPHIVLDSRLANPNDVFIALPAGGSHNPQDFIPDLLSKDVICIADKSYQHHDLSKVILVEDTVLALGAIAADYKKHIIELQKSLGQEPLQTIAVTGSNGKTTLKNMLNSVFVAGYGAEHVCCTQGNLNNHLGLPLTLLSLNTKHKILIAELGMNHIGEIDYLSKLVKPEIAVVNNYHHAHIGHFSSIYEIIDAKNEIFNYVTKLAIVNDHDGYYKIAQDKLKQKESNVEFLALNTSDAVAILQNMNIKLKVLGQHNYANALTTMKVAEALGISQPMIKQGLESYTGYQSRLQCLTAKNGAMIIDDSYNANLESTSAAIKTLFELPMEQYSKRWFVFGDIKELGEYAVPHHKKIGQLLNEYGGVDLFLTVGDDSKYAHEEYHGAKVHFENNELLSKYLLENLTADTIVLFKGSKSMKLPAVVACLLA